MASSLIHITVANEINKVLKKDKAKLLIGSIAPDIAKIVGTERNITHFIDEIDGDIPNLDRFLEKYKKYLSDDFVLGYYIHLYTDYLWFKYFMTELVDNDKILKMDNKYVKLNGDMLRLYIYNDYTNLNRDLIEEYNLDLKIFYNEIPKIDNIITEIPIDKINLLIDKAGLIIANAKKTKPMTFDINNLKSFIKTSTDLIIANINEVTNK